MRIEDILNIKMAKDAVIREEDRYRAEAEKHKQVIASLRSIALALEIECDHTYPNGETAWDNSWTYSACKICGATDF